MERALLSKDGSYLNITAAKMREWEERFPGLDLDQEINKANSWLERNKAKRWKSLGGFENWLKRTFENSPRIKADYRSKGQLSYLDAVQRETREIAEADAHIPRPDYNVVEQICGQLLRSLPTPAERETTEISQIRCRHEWTMGHYSGVWCSRCGGFPEQFLTVSPDLPKEVADVLLQDARARYTHRIPKGGMG